MNKFLLCIDSYAWDRFLAAPFHSIRETFWDYVGRAATGLRRALGYI